MHANAIVNFRTRLVWGVFVQPDVLVFQIQGKHAVYQVSHAHRMPHPYSIGVECSGSGVAK